MTPELKTRWLAALRSGEYTQGRSTLRKFVPAGSPHTFAHCCLGVLACVAGVPVMEDSVSGRMYITGASGQSQSTGPYSAVIPADIRDKLGLTDTQQDCLITLNDTSHDYLEVIRCIEESL